MPKNNLELLVVLLVLSAAIKGSDKPVVRA